MAWETPKTNWKAGDVPSKDDFNRIEGNAAELNIQKHLAVLTAAGAISAYSHGAEKKQIEGLNYDYIVLAFEKVVNKHAFFTFVLPPDYQNGIVMVKIFWLAPTKTAGDVVWNFAALGRKSGETWDSELGATQIKKQTTANAAKRLNICTFGAYNPGWAAGDVAIVKVSRDAVDGDDTLDEDAHLLQVTIEYTGKQKGD